MPNQISSAVDKTLLERITADNDFIKYYISNVEFANKIIETNSGNLFQKFLQKTITTEEEVLFLKQLNLNSKKEFNDIAANLRTQVIAFATKFPELRKLSEKEQKELLVNAFKNLSTDNSISIKFVKARYITPEQCFWTWMACNSACFIACSGTEGNQCYWECSAYCAALYGFCWAISE